MVSRHDVVLAAIPVLSVGGFGLSRLVAFLAAWTGVGARLTGVPFTALGLVAALGVIGRALVDPDVVDDRRPGGK